jgi:hypothetical protein
VSNNKVQRISQAWWLRSVIPATQESEIRRIAVLRPAQAKSCKTPFQPIKAEHGCVCLSPKLHGSINRRITGQASLA